MDRENKAVKIRSGLPKKTQQNVILSFLAPLYRLAWPRSCWINYPERAMQSRLSCSLPPLQALLPSPIICLLNALYRHLSSRSATGAIINGTGPDSCLPELDMSPCCKSCVYGICAFVLRCFFSVLTLYSPMEHSLGVKKFFPPLFPHVNAVFFLHSLSSCSVYPVVICMLCMYGQVDG